MDQKNVEDVVDVSSFFLFEATGDSETDFELNVDVADADDDTDAQSCSCDLLDSCGTTFEPDNTGNVVPDHHFDDDIDVDDGQEEEEDGEVIDQDWSGTTDGGEVEVSSTAKAAGQHKKKSRVCVDSTMEVMNEVDKNRLFWEACLAS